MKNIILSIKQLLYRKTQISYYLLNNKFNK
jgi:hypothetical protein